MATQSFLHSLKIHHELCIGCSHCVLACPAEALRVRNGKSVLLANHCVDCGECMRTCPTTAIKIADDDFEKIYSYKYRIALIPSVFLGQFPENVPVNLIYTALLQLGFTHIYESEYGVEILKEAIPEYQKQNPEKKPLLSDFCPAIVRLVQVRFPALADNLVLLKTPFEIAALFVQKELMDQGATENEIGIFYITPCAAKTISIKDPIGESYPPIAGTINMDVLFNRVLSLIKKRKLTPDPSLCVSLPSAEALNYTLTRGEQAICQGRSFAIDGIHNVIDFLEKVENEDIKDIDYIELRACNQSCSGGVLTVNNKFLTTERLQKLAQIKDGQNNDKAVPMFRHISVQAEYLKQKIGLNKIPPRSTMKLDDNIDKALQKMEQLHNLIKQLPLVDCTLCGAPNCRSLAYDIVLGRASIEQCIFIQKTMEEKGQLTNSKSAEKFKEVWGNNKS